MLNVLNLARKNRCRILQASTSEVYGNPMEHPQRESYCGHVNIIGIRSCYDERGSDVLKVCVWIIIDSMGRNEPVEP